MKKTYEERFWSRVQKTDGCWLWTAGKNNNGYGWFKVNGKMVLAHRFSYELHIGPIPEGLVLDHVKARGCTNRTCVNPAHLEPVTELENIRRGEQGSPDAMRKHWASRRGGHSDAHNRGRQRSG